jgi:hypothetical protein
MNRWHWTLVFGAAAALAFVFSSSRTARAAVERPRPPREEVGRWEGEGGNVPQATLSVQSQAEQSRRH